MTVLGEIALRLKTDLGELARASVDPEFSRLRDKKMFEEQVHDRDRKEDLQDAAKIRQNALADAAEKETNRLQTLVITKAVDQAVETGDSSSLLRLDNKRGNLSEPNQSFLDSSINANFQQGLDGLKFEHKQKVDFQKLTLDEKNAALNLAKYQTGKDEFNATQTLKEKEFRLKQMKQLGVQHKEANNRRAMLNYIRTTPDIGTEAERSGFEIRLKGAITDKAVSEVWDEIQARYGDRIDNLAKNHRNKIMAKALTPTDPSGFDLSFAESVLQEKVPEFEDMNDKFKKKMIEFVADRTNELGRSERTASNRKVLEAIEAAKQGIIVDEDGGFLFFDAPGFSVEGALGKATTTVDSNGIKWRWNGEEPYESQSNWLPE